MWTGFRRTYACTYILSEHLQIYIQVNLVTNYNAMHTNLKAVKTTGFVEFGFFPTLRLLSPSGNSFTYYMYSVRELAWPMYVCVYTTYHRGIRMATSSNGETSLTPSLTANASCQLHTLRNVFIYEHEIQTLRISECIWSVIVSSHNLIWSAAFYCHYPFFSFLNLTSPKWILILLFVILTSKRQMTGYFPKPWI